MAKKKASVTVMQYLNPRYDNNKPKHPTENSEFSYKVERTVNTLTVSIGQMLVQSQVQTLIDDEIDVTVVPVK